MCYINSLINLPKYFANYYELRIGLKNYHLRPELKSDVPLFFDASSYNKPVSIKTLIMVCSLCATVREEQTHNLCFEGHALR